MYAVKYKIVNLINFNEFEDPLLHGFIEKSIFLNSRSI